jgi:hypothetical protein
MALIYKFTHIPTNKIYIGAKKNDSLFEHYNSSSQTVSSMMKANPAEWLREIIHQYPTNTPFEEVVAAEQAMIKQYVDQFGWGSIWNEQYRLNVGAVYSPATNEKRNAAGRTQEARQKKRENTIKFFSDHTEREKQSKRRLDFIARNPSHQVGDGKKGGAATMASGKGSFANPDEHRIAAALGGKAQGKINAASGHLKRIAQLPNKRTKGLIWVTNGTANLMLQENEAIPDGFKRGKTQKRAD